MHDLAVDFFIKVNIWRGGDRAHPLLINYHFLP